MATARRMAGRPDSTAAMMVGTLRRSRAVLLCSTALQAAALLVLVVPAQAGPLAPNAQPQGGQVVAGQASIIQSTTSTTVQQSSSRAAVDWQSFNVGSAQSVTFQQPSASATTLNRVVGPDPSAIAGRITANGNVVLVNPSGVVFKQGSQVNVNSLVVSTAGIGNTDFMAGKTNFSIPGSPNAMVVNNGTITVKQSGLAALVAPAVANHGVINARMGQVVLAGATTHTVDLYGDGLLAIDVTGQVKQVPVGAKGQKVTALVTNTGTILAQGGTITLTAAAADGIVTNLVTAGGKISADGGRNVPGGSIVLNGVGGSLVVQGDLTARGSTGGSVQALADGGATLAPTAKIDVSGRNGGGTVALGTTLARAVAGPSLVGAPMAASVTVAPGAVVKANATRKGNGGTITLLSSTSTSMAGTLSARGGAQGGNGGFVEVSSGKNFSLTGSIDLAAPLGTPGTVLLDPWDLTVISGKNGPGSLDATLGQAQNNGTIYASDGNPYGTDTITDTKINGFGATVRLQAQDAVTVNSGVAISLGAGLGFTLEAGNAITVNTGASIAAGGNILLATGSSANLLTPIQQVQPGGTLAQPVGRGSSGLALYACLPPSCGQGADPTPPASTPRAIQLNGASITSGGTLSLLAGAGGDITGTGPINAAALIASTSAGQVSLTSGANTVPVLGNVSATKGLDFVDGVSLAVNGTVIGGAGPVTLKSSGDITIANSMTTGSATARGDLTVTAGGGITVNANNVTDGKPLVITVNGDALFQAGNVQAGAAYQQGSSIELDGSLIAKNVTVTEGGNLGGGNVTLNAGGDIIQDARNTQTGTGGITAVSLTGAAFGEAWFGVGTTGATGYKTLNHVAALGNFSASRLIISDSGDLVVSGPLTTTGPTTGGAATLIGRLEVDVGGALTVNAPLHATQSVLLDGYDLTLSKSATVNGSSVTLSASNQLTTGATSTLLLASGAQVMAAGDIILTTGDANKYVSVLPPIQPAGQSTIKIDGATVTSSGGNVYLLAGAVVGTAPGGAVSITGGATIAAQGPKGTVSIQADSLTVSGSPTISGNTIQIAPATAGTVVNLGGGTTGLLIDQTALAALGRSGTLSVGAASTPPLTGTTATTTTTAGIVNLAGPVNLGASILGLFSTGDITQAATAVLTVANLVGSAGTAGTAGNITLNEPNAIGAIGLTSTASEPAALTWADGLTATGNIALTNTPDLHIVGATGLVSGVRTAVPAASLTLTETGALTVDGSLGNCGTGLLSLSANSITIGTPGATPGPKVWSFGAANLSASTGGTGITVNNGVLNAVGIDVTSGALVQNGGVIASFGMMSLPGSFTQNAGTAIVSGALSESSGSVLTVGGTLAAGSGNLQGVTLDNTGLITSTNSLTFGKVQSNSGTIVTQGDLQVQSITAQSGNITATGNITVGTGTGTAGTASGVADSGAFLQSTGTVLAGGNITVWSTGAVTQDNGTLAAGGTVAITGTSLAQGTLGTGAALISGGSAVRLYATQGDARQGSDGTVAGSGSLAAGSGGIAIQAPNGDNTFGNLAPASTISAPGTSVSFAFVCSSLCTGNKPGPIEVGTAVAASGGSGTADVLLLGKTIDLFGDATASAVGPAPVLNADTLWLFSLGDTTEKANGVIAASTVSGNAGFLATPALPGGLQAPANWTQTANSNASLGTVSAAGPISNPNQITTLGTYAATGALSLTNSTDLTIKGATAGTTATITAPTITMNGPVTAPTVTLTANTGTLGINGTVDASAAAFLSGQTGILGSNGLVIGNGALTANSANGSVELTNPLNVVASVTGSAASTFGLWDSVNLTIAGNITAPSIQIGATGLLTVANGVTITTGYQQLPQVPASQAPPDSNGSTGLNLAIFNGSGTIDLGPNLTIQGTGGAARQTVRLALTGGGLIKFGSFNAPGADLLLHVGSGSATGNINVYSLSAFYQTGYSGPIDLTGTVGGQTGGTAASLGRIAQEPTAPQPFAPTTNASVLPGSAYQVNKCPITSVNCGFPTLTPLLVLPVVPQTQVAAASTLRLPPLKVAVVVPANELDDPDLLLPYISDRDN